MWHTADSFLETGHRLRKSISDSRNNWDQNLVWGYKNHYVKWALAFRQFTPRWNREHYRQLAQRFLGSNTIHLHTHNVVPRVIIERERVWNVGIHWYRLHHPCLDWSVCKFQAHDRYRKSRYSLHTSDTQYAYVRYSLLYHILLVVLTMYYWELSYMPRTEIHKYLCQNCLRTVRYRSGMPSSYWHCSSLRRTWRTVPSQQWCHHTRAQHGD